MPHLLLVNAQDIIRWADTRRAQEDLPALVRRLIHATTSTARHVGLPAGEAVQSPGYDGVVVIDEEHHAIPRGLSVWEMGANKDVSTKASGDYSKRTATPPVSDVGEIVPAHTTFVFVTPRRWSGKTDWAHDRRTEGVWRDVQVLDVDDVIGWLEQAAAVHVWLSNRLGKRPTGADDLDSVWRDWSEATTPPLSAALMFSGRETARDALLAWLRGADANATLGVESESPEETVSLVAAALQTLPEEERVPLLARAVLVRDADALSELAVSDAPLTIVAAFPAGDLVQRAVRNGHRVLLALAPGTGVTATLTVPRLHRDGAMTELEAMGVGHDRARDLAGLARRSMLALRRRLATSASVNRPAWAAPEVGSSLLPILLIGAFDERMEGDREAYSSLAGETADAAVARLVRWAADVDPPVRRVGSIWFLVSKADAWESLARFVTRDLLERFETIALVVLGTPDPTFDLAPDQRWAASIYKKERSHSALLMRAVADTLALLGTRGNALSLGGGVTAATTATKLVRTLFERAGRGWTRWASFAEVLPLLAEAAPDEVLSALDAGLAGDDSPVMGLFGHDTGHWGSSSPHTHLLWALERMAWSPNLLGPAALLLAQLARRDPGGKLSNRPRHSLRTIFLPWIPQTSASLETRLAVIDMLRQREPASAWILMVDLLPKLHDHSTPTGVPDWRDWAPEIPQRVTNLALERHANEMVSRLLDDVGTDAARWCAMVETLDDVPFAAHDKTLAQLAVVADTSLSSGDRCAIWNALRKFLSRHRSASQAAWALPAERLAAIDDLFQRFRPDDVVDQHAWLFSSHPVLAEGRENDWREHQRILGERRVEAAGAWHEVLTPTQLIALSTTLSQPENVGAALGESEVVSQGSDEATLVSEALAHEQPAARAFGRAFLGAIMRKRGAHVLIELLEQFGRAWPETVRAEALLALPPNPTTWAEVARLGNEAQERYWQQVPNFWVERADVDRAMTELIRHGRPHAAIELASMAATHDAKSAGADESTASAETIAQALLVAASTPADFNGARSSSHEVAELLDLLERAAAEGRITEEQVARLELVYLPILSGERDPRLLHKELARDPAMFVEAACLAYRGDGEPPREMTETDLLSAHLAGELLQGWRAIPGFANGLIDRDHLMTWIITARAKLSEANRIAVGDVLIGEVLSGSPVGADGAWPHEAVRDVIETVRSDALERGIRTGKFNQRGVVTKHPLEGGALERDIVARYEADAAAMAQRWTRTAAMLRALAATYQHDAKREDDAAELRHDLDI